MLDKPNLNQTEINKNKKEPNNLKYASTKEVKRNMFLKTNQKPTLNPIKNKKSMYTTDNKRYFQSNFSYQKDENNEGKTKEELNAMKKSLFYDNTSNNYIHNKDAISIINKNLNKMKSSTQFPKIKKMENSSKDDLNDIENEDNKNNNKIRKTYCRSKTKSKNTFVGKETKIHISNKRNQSTNNNKKRTFKSTLDANNVNINKNNIKWKNN